MSKDKFYSCFSRMNENIGEEERSAFNSYRLELWLLSEKALEISRMPSVSNTWPKLPKLCKELHEKISNMLVLFGDSEEDD